MREHMHKGCAFSEAAQRKDSKTDPGERSAHKQSMLTLIFFSWALKGLLARFATCCATQEAGVNDISTHRAK